MPTLIFVHGRGLKPPKDVERQNWLQAVNRGLLRLGMPQHQLPNDQDHVRLAYWSDLFYPSETVNNPDQVDSTAGIVNAAQAGLDDAQTRSLLALVDKFWSWRLPQPGAPAEPDSTTKQFEDGFARDVIKFFGLGYGDKCAEPLREQLRQVESGDAVILVSHSFGTVIAYEVLIRDLDVINQFRAQNGRDQLAIDAWVTMGSPLAWAVDLQAQLPTWKERLLTEIDQGIQPALDDVRNVLRDISDAVRQRVDVLQQRAQPPRAQPLPVDIVQLPPKQFPNCVGRWFNVYDVRDPVACAGGLSGVIGGGLAVGETYLYQDAQRAFDLTIRNDNCPATVHTVDIRAHDDFNGYGQCAQLAQVIADVWQRSNGQWM